MKEWTRGFVVAHNGHDRLVQELHLWKRHKTASLDTGIVGAHNGHDTVVQSFTCTRRVKKDQEKCRCTNGHDTL